MLKVILVDDEPIVRRALRELVDWKAVGLEISNEAFNGLEALRMIEAQETDIVITDLKMPVMNGLELISHVRTRNADIKFVVLSAYDDFPMVSEAYKLGVEDYILKSALNSGQLFEILKKLADKIHGERYEKQEMLEEKERTTRQKEELQRVQAYISSNRKAIREKLLKDLIGFENGRLEDITEQCRQLGIDVDHGQNLIGIFTADDFLDVTNGRVVCQCKEQSSDEILEILEAVLAEYHCGEVYAESEFRYIILFSFDPQFSSGKVKEQLDILYNDIFYRVHEKTGLKISAGLSDMNKGLDSAGEMYKQAKLALAQVFFSGKGIKIFYSQSPIPKTTTEYHFFTKLASLRSILEHINECTEEEQLACLCFDESQLDISQLNAVKDVFRTYYYHILEYAHKNGIFQEIENLMGVYETHLDKHGDLLELNAWCKCVLLKLLDLKNSGNCFINRARIYIHQNYAKGISLVEVAEHIGFNHSYFSRLFSQETGTSFTQYLGQVRIEAAINYLTNTSLSVNEIAEKVGYSNQENFSRFFKSATGKSPSHFRNK